MEPSVNGVRYPYMRMNIVHAVEALSDPDYQQRVWIRLEYPQPNYYDSFDQNVHILFDDGDLLPEPEPSVGTLIYPDEVDVLRALGAVLDPLIDELGDVRDAEYLAHPAWPDVVSAAADAYRVLHANDVAHGSG